MAKEHKASWAKPKRPAPSRAPVGQGRGTAVTEIVPVPVGSSNVAVQVTVGSWGPALPPPLTLDWVMVDPPVGVKVKVKLSGMRCPEPPSTIWPTLYDWLALLLGVRTVNSVPSHMSGMVC